MRHSIGCAATVALALALHLQAGAAEPWLEQQTLFRAGQRGSATYRIPALVVTTRGTVLAVCEGRQRTGSDWDDGQSWSKPVNISPSAMNPAWPFAGTGPGHGIQLASGRLLIPCWADSTPRCGEIQTSYCFYSDDHGASWKLGQPLTRNASDECDVVELADGSIYLNARSRQDKKQRAYAFSKDGGQSWSEVRYDTSQPEPSCDGAVVRLTHAAGSRKDRVLVSCPANPNARDHMTIRLSYDQCRTWPVAKVLDPGYSGYSDLAVTDDHTILCLYETEGCRAITLARFNLEWLTDGRDSVTGKSK